MLRPGTELVNLLLVVEFISVNTVSSVGSGGLMHDKELPDSDRGNENLSFALLSVNTKEINHRLILQESGLTESYQYVRVHEKIRKNGTTCDYGQQPILISISRQLLLFGIYITKSNWKFSSGVKKNPHNGFCHFIQLFQFASSPIYCLADFSDCRWAISNTVSKIIDETYSELV